tara:strand:- start:96 stop:308 length:213 start_codon:yes stop_codon:yes gene_type:complete
MNIEEREEKVKKEIIKLEFYFNVEQEIIKMKDALDNFAPASKEDLEKWNAILDLCNDFCNFQGLDDEPSS